MNKKIEMAKIESKNGTYYIYKCINAGKIQYNVDFKDDSVEYFCESFYFYKDALNYVVSLVY